MRRIYSVLPLASVLILAPLGSVPSANAVIDLPQYPPSSSQTTSGVEVPDSKTNRTLDFMAKKLALAVSSEDVRQTVHGGVKKRFDGDTEALWSSLAEGSSLNADVAAAANRGQVLKRVTAEQVATTARSLPQLQIAVPEKFDSWDPATYTPLVAFVPEGVNDLALTTITAYDADGNTVLLDAQVAPENPVIVLGLNERTDKNGELLYQDTSPDPQPERLPQHRDAASAESDTIALAASQYQVRYYLVSMENDKEPWAKGAAEVYGKAKSRGCSGVDSLRPDWAGLDHDGDAWQGPLEIGHTTCDVVFAFWEDDGGAYDFDLMYGTFNLGVHMDDADDMFGRQQVAHSMFLGAGTDQSDKVDWDALYIYVD